MLTMVLPAYNEEAIIRANAIRVADTCEAIERRLGVRIDVVVLDDGSTDGTRAEVEAAQRLRPRLGYHWAPGPSRREILAAFMLGAGTEYVGWMDSDLATSLEQLEELVVAARRHDIVTGSRYLPSSRIHRTRQRLLISVLYNNLVRLGFGSRISDHWCGFKVFRRDALATLLEVIGTGVEGRQMFWDAQMWVAAQRMRMSILEIPVQWHEGEKSALKLHTELPMAMFTARYWARGDWRRIGPLPAAAPLAGPVAGPVAGPAESVAEPA